MKVVKPNLVVEAYDVLVRKLRKDDCRAILKKLLAKRKKTILKQLFQPAILMMDACADIGYDEKNPLFVKVSEEDEDALFIADAFFLQYIDLDHEQVQLWNAFSKAKNLLLQDVLNIDEIIDPIQDILHSDVSDTIKLALIEIMVNGEVWIKQFETLLREIMQRIKQVVKEYEHYTHYVEEFVKDEVRFASAMKRMGLGKKEVTEFVPKLCGCNVGMTYIPNQAPDRVIVYFGVVLCVVDFFTMNDFDHRELSDHLKMLADPTKRSILKILRKQETYQSDLANQLSLTTATISHHVDQLFQNGFIQSEIRDGKVYYLYQEDMVNHTIEQLKRYLGSV